MTITLDRSLAAILPVAESGEFSVSARPQAEKNQQSATISSAAWTAVQTASIAALAVPRASDSPVLRAQAEAALGRIMQTLPATVEGTEDNPLKNMGLKQLEGVAVEHMFLAATLMTNEILGQTAKSKGAVLEKLTEKQNEIRQQELADYKAQLAAEAEQQEKAKKAGIMGVVFDWVIAAVEVVTGIAKVVGGIMSCNPMMVAGGAMDVLAGSAGIVKAVANTLALVDPDNAEKYQDIAEKAGYVQLGFEIAGALVDVTSAARNAIVSKVIPNVAKKVLQEGAEQALSAGIKSGSKAAVTATAQQIGKKVAAEATQHIGKKLGDKFCKEAIEKMVIEAVETAAKKTSKALKKGADKAVKEITDKVVAEVRWQVITAFAKSSFNATKIMTNTRQVVSGAQALTSAAIEKQKADLRKEIDLLILDQQWQQMFFQYYEDRKKEIVKKVREMQSDQAQVMEGGIQVLSQIASNQVQMASSMV